MDARDFVPLSALLRAPPAESVAVAPPAEPAPPPAEPCASCTPLRDVLLFRAALADALDAAVARMLRELAAEVLARELRLAPCDVAAIVARVRAQMPVLRVRVAPADARCALDLPVVADATLEPGDAILELDGGALDARLGVRLACLLETCS